MDKKDESTDTSGVAQAEPVSTATLLDPRTVEVLSRKCSYAYYSMDAFALTKSHCSTYHDDVI